jgi:hypothetical protein
MSTLPPFFGRNPFGSFDQNLVENITTLAFSG